MVEQDRYCLDEMQQISAVTAALREVAVLLASQHFTAGLERAASGKDAESLLEEIKAVLRAAIRQEG